MSMKIRRIEETVERSEAESALLRKRGCWKYQVNGINFRQPFAV